MAAIVIEHLSKDYDGIQAVSDVCLTIDNEIFGLLGPNGSGKTTTVRILTTLIPPTSGTASICGFNIFTDSLRVRQRIGYFPQEMALDIKFTGRENIRFFADMFEVEDAAGKVEEVLKIMDLTSRADDLVSTYSGGMRRRLELAQALVHEPDVLFLDEPTIGLDVAARKKIWAHIHKLKKNGMTVFVTTHYMDEADEFCDRVAIIDKGRIIAVDSPKQLKGRLKMDSIIAHVTGEVNDLDLPGISLVSNTGGRITFSAPNINEALPIVSRALDSAGLKVHALYLHEPSLDDVFLELVGPYEESGSFNDQKFRIMLRRRR
jgi:ABC-2 type transport system ATP-binding protein